MGSNFPSNVRKSSYLDQWALLLILPVKIMLDTVAYKVVTDRRDHSINTGKNRINEDHSAHPIWLRADFVLPSPFLVCPPETTRGRSARFDVGLERLQGAIGWLV